MNANTKNQATIEAARCEVVDGLIRSDRNVEAGPEGKELDESIARRPGFRSAKLLMFV